MDEIATSHDVTNDRSGGKAPSWLHPRRRIAIDRAVRLGFGSCTLQSVVTPGKSRRRVLLAIPNRVSSAPGDALVVLRTLCRHSDAALNPPSLPRALSLFIWENIHSVSQLEVLLLLRERGGEWSSSSVADELRLTNDSAALRLHELHVRALLRKAAAAYMYSYWPGTAQLRSSVDDLATCYAAMRHSVITAIFSVPGDSAWALARAFRFRRH